MTSANKSRFVLIIMGILMVILSPIVAKYICDNLLAGGDGGMLPFYIELFTSLMWVMEIIIIFVFYTNKTQTWAFSHSPASRSTGSSTTGLYITIKTRKNAARCSERSTAGLTPRKPRRKSHFMIWGINLTVISFTIIWVYF